jgi:hypothetical protein
MKNISSSRGILLAMRGIKDLAGCTGSIGKTDCYLTDTGRTWGGKHSVRDAMPGAGAVPMESTDDLVEWIRSAGEERLYLTVHPERWAMSEGEWIISSSKDAVVNFGKKILMMVQ